MTTVEKPAWLKLKEMHDAEEETILLDGRHKIVRKKSHGATYGPSESLVDQVGDGLIDVNDLMKRFERMPTAEELEAAGLGERGFYEDFIGAPDFEQALQISNAAKAKFALLPATMRARFNHNPAEFLAFVNDAANHEECEKLGIKKPKPAPKEPEVTLKDINETLKAAQGKKKTTPRGGDNDEE